MHCKKVLNNMLDDYAGSTIRQTYIAMGTMFRSAVMNDVISKHPMDGVRYTKPVKAASDHRVLTVDEQRKFLDTAKTSHNYYQYAFILETGLRTGEMIGLTWDAIDWDNHTLTVNKTLEFRHKQKFWRAGPPKTQTSYRTIPLTTQAYSILLELKEKRKTQKLSSELSKVLTFTDRKTGQTASLVMSDLVFINFRTGMPAKNSSYDTHLYKLCDEQEAHRECDKSDRELCHHSEAREQRRGYYVLRLPFSIPFEAVVKGSKKQHKRQYVIVDRAREKRN